MGLDVIHGHKTIFPVPLAQACSFDDETFIESTSIAASDAAEGAQKAAGGMTGGMS